MLKRSKSHPHFDIEGKDAKRTSVNIFDSIREDPHRTPDVTRVFLNREINRFLYDKSFKLTRDNRKNTEVFFQFLIQLDPDAAGRVLLDNIRYGLKPELNEILIDSGARVDIRDQGGRTALFYALSKNIAPSLIYKIFQNQPVKSNLLVGKYKADGKVFDISLLEVAALCSGSEVFRYFATTFNDQIIECLKNFARMLESDHVEMAGRFFGLGDINKAIDRLIYYANTKQAEPYIGFVYITHRFKMHPLSISNCLDEYARIARNLNFAPRRCRCNSFFFRFWRQSYSEKTLHLITMAQERLLGLTQDSQDLDTLLEHPVFHPLHNQYGVDPDIRQALINKFPRQNLSVEIEHKRCDGKMKVS